MEFFIKYFRYHCHVISCIINYYIISVENGLMTNVTSETLEYYLSNDTTLVPFESVSKNYMLAYLNVNCLNALLTLQCNEHCGEMWLCGRDPHTVDREELYQLPFKHLDNFVCLFRGRKLKDPTHPEKQHVTDSLVISFSKLPLT